MSKRIAVVTGTSTGIGLEVALQLAKSNYIVVATTRDVSSAPPELGSICDVQPLDVTDEDSARALTTHIAERYGHCDLLINNAGYGILGNMESMTVESAKSVFDVNVWGVMRMCQHLVPLMRLHGGGLIITVSSTSGIRGLPCSDIYTASKMAVQGLMESYRYSVEQDNIKVAIVNPGPTKTSYADRMREETSEVSVKDPYPKLTDHYARSVTMNNASGQSAEDCARSILEVVRREIDKDVTKGDEVVYWLNAVSDFSRNVIERMIRYPDGHSGVYADIYKGLRTIVAKLKAEESEDR